MADANTIIGRKQGANYERILLGSLGQDRFPLCSLRSFHVVKWLQSCLLGRNTVPDGFLCHETCLDCGVHLSQRL
jgi:hypothetical protein